MIETQLKTLIKSVDALTLAIINSTMGGTDANDNSAGSAGTEDTNPEVQDKPAGATVKPADATQQNPGPGSVPPQGDQPGAGTVDSAPGGNTGEVHNVEPQGASKDSIGLQERIMHIVQDTGNMMLSMQLLALYQVNAFSQLNTDQLSYLANQSDEQLVAMVNNNGAAA